VDVRGAEDQRIEEKAGRKNLQCEGETLHTVYEAVIGLDLPQKLVTH
jgi:hypothetical protein